MSVAWEMVKKLPKKGLWATLTSFRQLFDDFSGYRYAEAKISIVLEDAQLDGSNDTKKTSKFDNFSYS